VVETSSGCDLDAPVMRIATYDGNSVPRLVLDVGAGYGKLGYLYKYSIHFEFTETRPEVVSIEVDRKCVPILRRTSDHVIIADAANLPLRNRTFRIGFLCEVIEHVERPRGIQAIEELRRVCMHVIISTPKKPYETDYDVLTAWKRSDFPKLRQYCSGVYMIFTDILVPSALRVWIYRHVLTLRTRKIIRRQLAKSPLRLFRLSPRIRAVGDC